MSKSQKTDDRGQKPDKFQELQQQVAELTEVLQRERADSLNLRRRVEEERAGMSDYYKAAIIRELLPAIDNLERALIHVPKDLKNHNYVKGVQGVAKQFEQCFKQLGVERIKTVGEHFDPHLHEAVHMDLSSEASAKEGDGGEHEVITEELQAGYKLGDEVIRHALVKVKKQSPSKPAGEVGEKK